MKLHPAAELFPTMSAEDFAALKADIGAHGQREPAVTCSGLLIDGRHRAKACEELGIQLQVCELNEDEDPYAYVLSVNLHRRHLTVSQRAVIAAKMANLKSGQRKPAESNGSAQSLEDAATILNVGRQSVVRARAILDKGSAKLVEAVEQGAITVSQAAKLVDAEPRKTEQTRLVNAGKPAIKKAIAEANGRKASNPTKEGVGHLDGVVEVAREFFQDVQPFARDDPRSFLNRLVAVLSRFSATTGNVYSPQSRCNSEAARPSSYIARRPQKRNAR